MTQREFPSQPLVGVGAIVFDREGRVLLVKRGNEPRKGHWSIPGGLLELGESLLDGLKREIAEETGLLVQPHAIVEVVDRIFRDAGRVRYHYVIIDYWCTVLDGRAQPASDAEEICWAGEEAWRGANRYDLEPIALAVLEKAWLLAQAANFAR